MTKMNGSFASTFSLWGQTVCCCLSLVADLKLLSFICIRSTNRDMKIWSLVSRWWSSSADSSSMNYRATLSKTLYRRDKQADSCESQSHTDTDRNSARAKPPLLSVKKPAELFAHVHKEFILLSTLPLMFLRIHIHYYTVYIPSILLSWDEYTGHWDW